MGNAQFWHIWFARLLFVVIFENVVACTIMAMRLIPDISSTLKYRIRRETFITKEILIRAERLRKSKLARNKSDSATLSSPDLHSGVETSFGNRKNGVAGGGVGLEGIGRMERSSRSTGDVKLALPSLY